MSRTKGKLNYKYTLTVDMTKIAESIIDSLSDHAAQWIDFEFDGEKLIVTGSDRCSYENNYIEQTATSPAEDTTTLIGSVKDEDIEHLVLKALYEISTIDAKLDVDENDYEYDDRMDQED